MSWFNPFAAINAKLDHLLALVQKGNLLMSKLDDEITQLASDVAALTAVDQSAIALINGISAQVQAAVTAALAAGATPAELQAITDLSTSLQANAASLGAAVAANTPPAPPGPAPQAKRKP